MFKVLTLLFCFVSAQMASAQSPNKTFPEYYTVSEKAPQKSSSLRPDEVLQDFISQNEYLTELKSQVLNLLNFELHKESFGNTAEAYQRLKHFGTWLKDSSTCLNTRAKILIRDSSQEVSYSNGGNGCTVVTGSWHDPYTDREYTAASQIQIDHVVPLKNAYISGAAKWDYQHRCLYANFLGNSFHLLAVDGDENMKKGDKGPENYMPPSSSYQCQYVQNWVSIKLIWGLGLNPDETAAVQQIVKDNHCDVSQFKFSTADLQKQRQFIQDNLSICHAH